MPETPTAIAANQHSARPPFRRTWRDALLGVALFALAFGWFLSFVDETPFHRDEARWIHRVYYLRELADPLGDAWRESAYPVLHGSLDEFYRLRAQPPAGSYALGLGLVVQGRDLETNGFWIMDRDNAWNEAEGNMPTRADLLAARRTNAFLGAVTVLCVYLIGSRLLNRTAGVAGALFLALHPLMRTLTTQALSDPLLICLVALAGVAAYRLADRPTWPRAALLGVLLGLGGATKLSPLLLPLPLAVLGLVLLAGSLRWRAAWRPLGWRLLPQPVIAGLTFLAAYPYLWRDPIGNTRALFAFRADSMALQASIWPNTAVETRTEAIERVIHQLGRLDRVSVEAASRLGIAPERVGDGQYLDLALAVAGLGVLGLLVLRAGPASASMLAGLVVVGQAGVTIAGLRTDFYRYHLPIVLAEALCVGLAIGGIWLAAAWLLASRTARRETRHPFSEPARFG